MRTLRYGGWLLALGLLLPGCADEQITPDAKVSKHDGRADGGPGKDGTGPSTDVVNDNGKPGEGGGPKPDSGPGPDLCSTPKSCPVTFSLQKGSESKAELCGDFNTWQCQPMTLAGASWQATVTLDHGKQVLYKFRLDGSTWISDPANPKKTSDSFQNSILDVACAPSCAPAPDGGGPTPDTGTPPTGFDWHDAVMYFVLVDRFADGDKTNNKPEPNVQTPANWQGGDLAGLLDKLKTGYFTGPNGLGVNVIWISSPIDVPDGKYQGDDGHDYTGYHGYWPAELDKVEEHIGDLATLKALVAEAHKQGVKIVFDYVMNHVHAESSVYKNHNGWFWSLQYSGKDCVCGGGCSWETSPEKDRCWFRPYLPDFNFTLADARKFSVDNAVKWAKDLGVDGMRLDAVKHIEMSWLTDLRSELKKLTPAGQTFYLVGETFTSDKGLLKSYIDPATKLDGQFDFPLRAQLVRNILKREGSLKELEGFLNANDGFYGPGAIMGTFLGNHDLPRSVNLAEDQPQFGDWDSGKSRAWSNQPAQPGYDRAYQRLGVAFAALLTLPGVPLIYYGDEIGLAGGGDPDNRRFMPWSGTSTDQDALRALVKKLTKIRASHVALRKGTRKQVWLGDDVYGYQMTSGSDTLVVVLNRSDSDQTITLTHVAPTFSELLGGGTVAGSSVSIPKRSALILKP
jgi:glycosidase